MRPLGEEIEDDISAEEENKIINEEYKTWKKNAPYLYDVVITHALEWPSLTCQWFPDAESNPGKTYTTHRLLLGTHTSGQQQDFLKIATVSIPRRAPTSAHPADTLSSTDYNESTGELGGHTIPPAPRIQVTQKISHQGEVNKARYMPQNPDLIATRTVAGEVCVFDRTKHPSEPSGKEVKPDIRLVGQKKDGFGLAWNAVKSGHVASCGEDMTVCHWDITSYTKAKSTIEPTTVLQGHTSTVGDVDWHPTQENILASVGDDKMLMIWDTRSASSPAQSIPAHEGEILSVSYSPAVDHLILTGSADKTILLHDLRAPTKTLHTFSSHTDDVMQLAWSPHNPSIFASGGGDRRINIWDLAMIGVEQSPEDAEDGCPELLFIHGGHTSKPSDFCWAPGEADSWTMTSTSEDNIVMVWQPTMRVWAGDEVKVETSELEDDAMDGVESTNDKTKTRDASSGAQSMSVSTSD